MNNKFTTTLHNYLTTGVNEKVMKFWGANSYSAMGDGLKFNLKKSNAVGADYVYIRYYGGYELFDIEFARCEEMNWKKLDRLVAIPLKMLTKVIAAKFLGVPIPCGKPWVADIPKPIKPLQDYKGEYYPYDELPELKSKKKTITIPEVNQLDQLTLQSESCILEIGEPKNMSNSTHDVLVVPVVLEKHPNADSLSLVKIFSNYQVVVRTCDWEGAAVGAYCPPDSVMPDLPQYSFLNGNFRVKAVKLRGCVSQGLLVPAPDGSQIGDNVAELLGVGHYVPPEPFNMGSEQVSPPPLAGEKYDIDTFFKYGSLIEDGEPCEFTEKIHGTNSRYSYQNGQMFAGSRNQWLKQADGNLYWQILRDNPWIEYFCKAHPDWILFGEIYGVQNLKYGCKKGERKFRAFDVYDGLEYITPAERHEVIEKFIPLQDGHVPILCIAPYSQELVIQHMNGSSTLDATHPREGVVVKPMREIWSQEIGRLIVKAVSPDYLASKHSKDE